MNPCGGIENNFAPMKMKMMWKMLQDEKNFLSTQEKSHVAWNYNLKFFV